MLAAKLQQKTVFPSLSQGQLQKSEIEDVCIPWKLERSPESSSGR